MSSAMFSSNGFTGSRATKASGTSAKIRVNYQNIRPEDPDPP